MGVATGGAHSQEPQSHAPDACGQCPRTQLRKSRENVRVVLGYAIELGWLRTSSMVCSRCNRAESHNDAVVCLAAVKCASVAHV